jgi:nucleoside phosphorylase
MRLVCSAWEDEIKELKKNLVDSNTLIQALGIGFLEASISLTRLLNQNPQIKEIVFLGTAGTYKKNLMIGEILSIKSTSLLNLGSLLDFSYTPIKNNFIEANSIKPGLKTAHCLSSMEITKKEIDLNIEENYILENMELYGVAKTAEIFSIPWSSLLGVTNYIGPNAHEEWVSCHESISQKLCQEFYK